MSTSVKKPPSSGLPDHGPSPSKSRSPTKSSTPATGIPASMNRTRSNRGANGTGAPISARAAVKKPGVPTLSSNNSNTSLDHVVGEDARAESTALTEDLKESLQRAEEATEDYCKQLQVMQSRLDDALKEQGTLEERLHEEEERIDGVENDKQEAVRQQRELERIYEAERAAAIKERDNMQTREEELLTIVQRLKDSLAQKENRPGTDEEGRLSRNSSFGPRENGHFAPTPSIQRSNSKNNSKLLLQKDKVIEGLRFELADAQLKIAELENMGGTRLHALEKKLLETRMANARLMEENESFQVLLSEKTLNGDFSRGDFMRETTTQNRTPPSSSGGPPPTSLADELNSLEDSHDDSMIEDVSATQIRRLEVELTSQKDQNKALTLYINKIIERLLQHQGFEHILSNAQEGPHGQPNGDLNTDKDLPPPPPTKDKAPPPPEKENVTPAPSFLQRAKSITTRGRPISMMGPPTSHPSVTENPDTAPRVPLGGRSSNKRASLSGHRHTPSTEISAAAAVVSNMYKPVEAPLSPGIVSPRNSFFPGMGSRIPSGQSIPEVHDEDDADAVDGAPDPAARNAALDALTGGADTKEVSVDTPSPPRSQISSLTNREGNAMFEGRKMRPLRLVKENEEAENARKANNRQSWFGGLFGGVDRGKGMPGSEQ